MVDNKNNFVALLDKAIQPGDLKRFSKICLFRWL
jgi:hypothetical protein